MALTRLKVCPVRSSAAMVLPKAGAAGFRVMRSISARFSVMAASSAGLKSATRTWSKGGTPPAGPTQSASRGFATRGAERASEAALKRPHIGWISSARCAILPAAGLKRNRSAHGRECGTPDLLEPLPSLCVRRRRDDALIIALEGQVMQHRAITDVDVFEPRCRCVFDGTDGRQTFELSDVVGVSQQLGVLLRRGQYPVLDQKLDVGDAAGILLDVELPGT